MPYINQESRKKYEYGINYLISELNQVDDNDLKGHLNYIISVLIKRQIDVRGLKYFRAQDLIGGVLSCAQMELYRRFLAPYEDGAKDKNGDI